jgi:acetylornithine deacetylase
MKGGLSAMLMAVAALRLAGASLAGDLVVESVVEEEAGGNGTLACALRGYRADGGIIADHSGSDSVILGNRGAQFFRITVYGQEAGIEEKWRTVSALDKAFILYQAVEAFSLLREAHAEHMEVARYYAHGSHSKTKVPTGVCTMRAGSWPSSIPGRCIMEGSLECLPGEDIHAIKASFADYVARVAQADPWLREHPPYLEWFGLWFEASMTDPQHPIVSELKRACTHVVGSDPTITGGGGNDLRCLTLYAQTPSVIFGPGGANFHGVDEYLDIDQLLTVTKILALSAIGWCGGAE